MGGHREVHAGLLGLSLKEVMSSVQDWVGATRAENVQNGKRLRAVLLGKAWAFWNKSRFSAKKVPCFHYSRSSSAKEGKQYLIREWTSRPGERGGRTKTVVRELRRTALLQGLITSQR